MFCLNTNDPRFDDEKYNPNRKLWFYEESPLFAKYTTEIETSTKEKLKSARIRRLLKTRKKLGCVDLRDQDIDFDSLTPNDLVEKFCKWSPKMAAILNVYAATPDSQRQKI